MGRTGACGGCDLQHVALHGQRALKADVVREQMARLAHLEVEVEVEPVPGDDSGLDWRTRVEFAVDAEGRAGLRRHRSHDVVPIDHCRIAAPGIDLLRVTEGEWLGVEAVDAVAPSVGEPLAVRCPTTARSRWSTSASTPRGPERTATAAAPSTGSFGVGPRLLAGAPGGGPHLPRGRHGRGRRRGRGSVPSTCMPGWACSPPRWPTPSGRTGQVVAVESDPQAADHARENLADQPHVAVADRPGSTTPSASPGRRGKGPRGSGVEPPRKPPARRCCRPPPTSSSSTRRAPAPVAGSAPRSPRCGRASIVYVACDPAALARDTAFLAELGYRLDGLRAFDAFPMTHHVECVATFRPAEGGR